MAVTVTVHGLPELKAMFARIPAEVGKKVLRRGVSAGTKIVKKAVLIRTPISKAGERKRGKFAVQPGTLRRALLIKFVREQSGDTQAMYFVTFRQGRTQQKGGRDAYYAKWVERGHKNVARYKGKYTDYKIRGRGRLHGLTLRRKAATTYTPPHPFLAPGFAASQGQATRAIVDTMLAEIKKLPGIS